MNLQAPSQAGCAFDRLADRYDEVWTNSTVGRLQRDAVWRGIDGLFRRGDKLLDFGCGTGEDAFHLEQLGMDVLAIDGSPEMIRVARGRGVRARVLDIEDLGRLEESFDGAISNFGALNCVEDLDAVRCALASRIRPGGHLAICSLGRFCLWETLWFLCRRRPRKAFRRWRPGRRSTALDIPVHHYSIAQLRRAFHPDFELREWRGIGLLVPPSYVNKMPGWLCRVFGAIDRRVAHWPVLRAVADHRLALFVRK